MSLKNSWASHILATSVSCDPDINNNFNYSTHTSFTASNVTYLTFSQWKTLYDADIEEWDIAYKDREKEFALPYYLFPTYQLSTGVILRDKDHPQFIKFKQYKDYKQWYKFWEKLETSGEDNENLQEILKLITATKQVAERKFLLAEQERKKAEKDYINKYQNVLEKLLAEKGDING